MLISRRVAESRLDLHLHSGGRRCFPFRQRTAANPRNRRRLCRLGRLQIFQLPRRRRPEAQPIHHLEPEGFSHQGFRGAAQFPLGADRGKPRAFPRRTTSARCTVCHSPFAIGRAASRLDRDRASGRRGFLRKLPRRGERLAARAYAPGLDLRHAGRRRHARSARPLSCARRPASPATKISRRSS